MSNQAGPTLSPLGAPFQPSPLRSIDLEYTGDGSSTTKKITTLFQPRLVKTAGRTGAWHYVEVTIGIRTGYGIFDGQTGDLMFESNGGTFQHLVDNGNYTSGNYIDVGAIAGALGSTIGINELGVVYSLVYYG